MPYHKSGISAPKARKMKKYGATAPKLGSRIDNPFRKLREKY